MYLITEFQNPWTSNMSTDTFKEKIKESTINVRDINN